VSDINAVEVSQEEVIIACRLHAEAHETHCVATEAQGSLPPLPIGASGSGRAFDQSDAARLGELLCGRALRCVLPIKDRVEKKVRRHMLRARKRKGFGWTRWSRPWLYETLKLFNSYRVWRWSMRPRGVRLEAPSPAPALA
jgi:hypothetical protein